MTKIKIKFSFLVFNALIFLLRDSEIICAFYIACISHELGHITAIKLTGGELKCIELSCFGIKITASPYSSLKNGIFVLLSGPAVNLLLYIIFKMLQIDAPFTMFNLAEGLFNLLPYSMLDGGAVMNLIAEGSIYEKQLNIIYFIIRIITAVVIVALLIL